MLDKVFVLRNEENGNVAFNIENLESDRLSDREVLMLYEYYKSGRLNDCSPKVKEDIVRFNKKTDQTNIVSEPYDMPLSPTIVISHDCNYNCSYCFEKDFRKSGVITPEHINNIEAFLDIYSKHYGVEKNMVVYQLLEASLSFQAICQSLVQFMSTGKIKRFNIQQMEQIF